MSNLFSNNFIPRCTYSVISLAMVQVYGKCSAYFYCVRWSYIASSSGSYLTTEDIKDFCQSKGWRYESQLKAIQKGIKRGWVVKVNPTKYRFVSNYTVLNDNTGKPGRGYIGTEVVSIPGEFLMRCTYFQFRGLVDGQCIKLMAERRRAYEYMVNKWSRELEINGFWKRRVIDEDSGEVSYVHGTLEDLEIFKQKNAKYLEFEIPQQWVSKKDQCEPSQGDSPKHNRFSIHEAAPDAIDGRGILAEVTHGSLYTQVVTTKPLDSFRVVHNSMSVHSGWISDSTKEVRKNRWAQFKDSNPFESLHLPSGFKDHLEDYFITRLYSSHLSVTQVAKLNNISVSTAYRRLLSGFYGNVTARMSTLILCTGDDPEIMREMNRLTEGILPHDLYFKAFTTTLGAEIAKKKRLGDKYDLVFSPGVSQNMTEGLKTKIIVLKFKSLLTLLSPFSENKPKSGGFSAKKVRSRKVVAERQVLRTCS